VELGGVGDDRATLAVVHRNLPVPTFAAHKSSTYLTVETEDVRFTYTEGSAGESISAELLEMAVNGPLGLPVVGT